uniref:Secreted protein n=1 Tax=Steinernema glaseri TaxID=37863 RepID=A0A1I7ZF01_9BILA
MYRFEPTCESLVFCICTSIEGNPMKLVRFSRSRSADTWSNLICPITQEPNRNLARSKSDVFLRSQTFFGGCWPTVSDPAQVTSIFGTDNFLPISFTS